MTAGIWLLLYDIAAADRERYIDWFHSVHVPEKLSRPGYGWAAHYEAPILEQGYYHYIAMFGGQTTSVFLNPSPAQLKLTQSEETRGMMALRQRPSTAILAHEWSWAGPTGQSEADEVDATIVAPILQLVTVEAPQHDEFIGSFCVQNFVPEVAVSDRILACHKMINVMGAPRHMMLLESAGLRPNVTAADQVTAPVMPVDFSPIKKLSPRNVNGNNPQSAVNIGHRWGQRIWPAVSPSDHI